MALALAGCGGPRPSSTIAPGSSDLAFDLYRKLRDREANFVFSPFSISTALAMLHAGARGQTAEEIARAAHFKDADSGVSAAFGQVTADMERDAQTVKERYRDDPRYTFGIANALWFQKDLPLHSDFKTLLADRYRASLNPINFTNPEQARRQINAWIDEHTQHKIKEIVPAGKPDRSAGIWVTNALYLQATWLEGFREEDTQPEDFWVTPAKAVKLPMMHQTVAHGVAEYAESDDCQLLLLPCTAFSRLALAVVLPRKRDGLADLERSMTESRLESLIASAWTPAVQLSLPRFTVESNFEMKTILEALGIHQAFREHADFSGVTDSRPLWLSAIFHKGFLAVNEKGIEAAAAAGGEGPLDGHENLVTFRADHPFMFMILHYRAPKSMKFVKGAGQIFFLGRFLKPPAR
jgi:serpin B